MPSCGLAVMGCGTSKVALPILTLTTLGNRNFDQINGTMEDTKDGVHFHTEDEIIVITGGEMLVGKQPRPRGTALAVDANTLYGFGCSDKGLSFVNFRPCEPWFGKPGIEPYSEKGMMFELVRKTKEGIPMDWSTHAAG